MSAYLYVLKPKRLEMLSGGPTAEEEEILARHADYLRHMAGENVVRLFGRTDDADEESFGIIVFEARSEEAAHRVMAADPAVSDGVMEGRLHPFRLVHPPLGS